MAPRENREGIVSFVPRFAKGLGESPRVYARAVRPSDKAIRWLLFGVFVFTLPIPYYLGGFELAPAARAVFLAGLILGVVATEGGGGYLTLFGWLAGVQALLLPLALWGVAALAARSLRLLPQGGARSAVALVLAAGMAGVSFFPIYDTPMSSRTAHSNVLGIFR